MNRLFCSITPDTARQILEEIADDLGKDVYVREQMGRASPSVWPGLNNLWKSVNGENPVRRDLITSLAKFTRNLVAAVPENQIKALYVPQLAGSNFLLNLLTSENEPLIRDTLFKYTSYYTSKDESSMSTSFPPLPLVDTFTDHRTTVLLIQSISNTVTGNEALLTRFWDIWMNVPENLSIILCVRTASPQGLGLTAR